MPKSAGQKEKIIYILRYLEENTDEEHSVTTAQIIEMLGERGITCDRKTVYSDMATLKDVLDYDILQEPPRNGGGWKLLRHDFEISELKMLVDAVQSTRFLSSGKSRELISKLEKLCSCNEAKLLNRQVYVSSRVKAENEAIFYIVDNIHKAIAENKQVSFTYLEWNISKELVTKGDEKRIVSPWALIWKDENYYLLAYDGKASGFKHFRVDKISRLNIEQSQRLGAKEFDRIDLGTYADTTFGMMGGKEESVSIDFPEALVGVVIDRFGKDISLQKLPGKRFRIRVKVIVSGQLYGWISGLGGGCRIHSPERVKNDYISWLEDCINNNKKEEG